MFFFTSLVVITVISIIWWYIQYYRHMKGVRGIPTTKIVLPLFGNLLEVRDPMDAYWVLHKLMMSIGKGKFLRGSLGFYFGIFIADPEFLEHVMTHTSTINKSTMYKFAQRWLGTGLLISSDDKWRSRRKLLTPAYHFKILEQFIDVFDKNSTILVEKLQSEIGKPRSNIFPYITLCTLDIICETAMGTSVNAQLNENSDFVCATKEMKRIFLSRGVSLIKHFDFTYQFTKDYRLEKESLAVLHGYTLSVIKSRRAQLLNEKAIESESKKNDDDSIGYKQSIPFLDLLLHSSFNGEPLSDEAIREEVDTFMFEGHDTVSSAISFCIYCISQHPEIQGTLIQEQQQIYGRNPDCEITYNNLQEMKYLEMVIKETLRLYPSVPLFGRKVTEDLKYRDYVIKKGTELGIIPYTLHRNSDIYPNPEVFDPTRFTPENQAKRQPFSYIPFSAGFRNCVGQKFAMLEMKSTVSKLLRNFVFTEAPDNNLKLKSEIILSSATGVMVTINRRIWKKQEFFKKIQNIPGPKQKFLFGNALDFKSADDFLLKLFQYQKENGLTYQMQLGLDSFVVTADPKLIECITTSTTQITKTSIYKFLANWVGDGLISASNPRWKLHRRLITPTFHFNILKDFVPVFYKNAHNLIDHWKSSLGKEFDAYEDVLACTLDIICETAMGISVNALRDGKHSNYLESVKFQGRCIMERSFSFWKQIDALYKLSPTYKKEMEMIRNIKKTTEEVIRRKKEEINNKVEKKNQFEDGDDLGMKPKSAFLDHLMTSIEQNNGLMSEEDLRDEVDTFIFAGHETTASSLSFALYFLAKHQDVQQKVYDEVVQVLDGGEEISNEKLPNLKYLDMVIKETLRVMPSVPVYFRMLTEDVNYNGQVFPKNLNLVLFAYGAHRNEEFFDNPEEFRPERFSSEAVSKRNTFAYVPFSAGPRNCIGQKFALIEMKCLLSALIKEFKFTKSPNFSIQPAVLGVAKSVNGVHLIIESRNN